MNLSKLIEAAVRDANAKGKGGEQVNVTQARNLIRFFLVHLQSFEGWKILKLFKK